MRHYVYNSALRDAAAEQLHRLRERLRVVSVGEDKRQHRLLASAGDVAVSGRIEAADDADVVLCPLAGCAALLVLPPPLVVCCGGLESDLTPQNLRALHGLEERGYELVSHQIAPADDKQDWEHVFVLARWSDADGAAARLKRAIAFDAHSLQTHAVREIERYNAGAEASAQIDPNLADRIHEVAAMPAGVATAQLGAYMHDSAYTSTEEVVFDASSLHGRALSIHLDGRALPDWPAHARRIADLIAMPEHVEVVIAPPHGEAGVVVDDAMKALRDAGLAVRVATPAAGAAEWTDDFLAHTAAEAMVVAYYGGPRVPVTRGWDWDVLRAAQNMVGPVFAFKTSPNKTRYISTAADALAAAEGFPIVSRAWLACCEQWSRARMAPHLFQALVAYQFDAVDWMNKHRKLRLGAITTVRTESIDGATADEDAFNATPPLRTPAEDKVRDAAKRIALLLHAADWAAAEAIAAPKLLFQADPRQLTLRARGQGQTARWSLSHLPFRPPV